MHLEIGGGHLALGLLAGAVREHAPSRGDVHGAASAGRIHWVGAWQV
jgi:hypothetical protein